jgi:hypothetical protein
VKLNDDKVKNYDSLLSKKQNNWFEVPKGKVDVEASDYLPKKPLTDGEWKMPRPALKQVIYNFNQSIQWNIQ